MNITILYILSFLKTLSYYITTLSDALLFFKDGQKCKISTLDFESSLDLKSLTVNPSSEMIGALYITGKNIFWSTHTLPQKKYPPGRDFLRQISTVFGNFLKKYLRYRNFIYLDGKP